MTEHFEEPVEDVESAPPRRAVVSPVERFDLLDLPEPLINAVSAMGWKAPTPVQQLCLPHTVQGRDVAGFAQTGTGKTGVFLITIANKLLRSKSESEDRRARAIILAPTRELAVQIEDDARPLFAPLGITSLVVIGGIDYDKQAAVLKKGVDVIVATPGRLKDYSRKDIVDLDMIEVFVCDEADRMFDMGFIEDVEFFLGRIPEKCQKLLFSATTNEQVKELAFEYLESPEYISVNPEVITPELIEQHAVHVSAERKVKVMLGFLRDHAPECAIIFTNTKLTAEWLYYKLAGNGVNVDLITGDLPQKKRIKLIQKIKEGQIKALIATDVASRGLHISRVSHVYNFDLPDEPANYVHRIGRTARAGAKGKAYSLVCDDYGQNLRSINEMLGEEYAISSEWFDESYLQIEDKAGNPFDDPNCRIGRSADDEDRKGRKGASGRGGRGDGDRGRRPERSNRPERSGRPERGPRGDQQSENSRQARRQDGQTKQHQQQQAQAQPHASSGGDPNRKRKRRRGRGGRDGGSGNDRQHGRDFQNSRHEQNRQGQGRGDQRPAGERAAYVKPEGTKANETPSTAMGLLKKIARTLFGKK